MEIVKTIIQNGFNIGNFNEYKNGLPMFSPKLLIEKGLIDERTYYEIIDRYNCHDFDASFAFLQEMKDELSKYGITWCLISSSKEIPFYSNKNEIANYKLDDYKGKSYFVWDSKFLDDKEFIIKNYSHFDLSNSIRTTDIKFDDYDLIFMKYSSM